MGPLDFLWHVSNLFVPGLMLGALAATATKLLWRKELGAMPWRRLALPACLASAGASVLGLVVLGRDGQMLTYGAMVCLCAVSLWWTGFVRPKRAG